VRYQHRHFWQPTDEPGRYACTDCEETCAECIECLRWTGNSLLICERCVRRVRGLIDDIETAMALYCPPMPSLIPPIRYDRDQITGSRGSDFDPKRWTYHDLPDILEGWADAWADASGMPRTIGAADYLRGHVLWAAHNRDVSDWDQWLTEMRRILSTAKREAGILPKRLPTPCVHCGGVAVQTWADKDLTPHADGLSDEVTCLGCHLTWRSAAQYAQVSKDHLVSLPEDRPDAIVTIEQAATVWPEVPAKTWATWANRAELPDPAAWDVRGRAQYRVGDLDVLVQRRTDATRRGRRAC